MRHGSRQWACIVRVVPTCPNSDTSQRGPSVWVLFSRHVIMVEDCHPRKGAEMHGRLIAFLGSSLLLLTCSSELRPSAENGISTVKLLGETETKARRLAVADKLAADGLLADAVADYVHLLNDPGDDLVPVTPLHSVQLRRLCHLRLAALPAAALALYRAQTDAQAAAWWLEAERSRDPVPVLRRLVDQAFCSRWGDKALDRLGDLAFERGRFDEAACWWRMLARSASDPPIAPPPLVQDLVFPDPQVDIARVRAKQVLLHLILGDDCGFDQELAAFRRAHGPAGGALGGRTGSYGETLATLRGRSDRAENAVADWETFAGSPARQFIAPQSMSSRLLAGNSWSVRLRPPLSKPAGNRQPSRVMSLTAAARSLPFQPVITHDQVFVAGARQVAGYALRTGEPLGRFVLPDEPTLAPGEVDESLLGAGPYSLTVAEDRLYVRLGAQSMTAPRGAKTTGCRGSYLVCLGLTPNSQGTYPLLWQVKAQERESAAAIFEGSPVVDHGRVYIARLSFASVHVASSVDCYSATTGSRRWRQEVFEAPEPQDGGARRQTYLLTLAGPNIAYCSHAGAVIAVDALTGRRAWSIRYARRPRRHSDESPMLRDCAPCVYRDGRLWVAPTDYDRVLCLEAGCGSVRWQSERTETCQLLGVARGKLVLTTALNPRGIRALDLRTGTVVRSWLQPDDASDQPTYGRGIIAGDKVYWPTVSGIRVLDQDDGLPDEAESLYLANRVGPLPGNLAFGCGCLAVADGEQLRVFVPPAGRGRSTATPNSCTLTPTRLIPLPPTDTPNEFGPMLPPKR
jgi:outer membrane protein assembly factor BamB